MEVAGSSPAVPSMKKEKEMKTLTVVVRDDLNPGLQAAQAVHAMREFTAKHPETDLDWFQTSKNLALLQVPNEEELENVLDVLSRHGVEHVEWREPDRNNELTAVAVAPEGNRYLSTLPLLLRKAA